MKKRIVILISGRGSNMAALLDAGLPATISAVISNEPQAKGLEIAHARGVSTQVIDHRDFGSREEFDDALAQSVEAHGADLIVLAGFMRILSDAFVRRYAGRLINIHPSLLPAFPGVHTHRRALEEGVRLHGCTVHFVTPTLDRGPIIIQAAVPVLCDDTESSLAARVLAQEHRIFPQAVRWFLEGRLSIDGKRVVLRDHRTPSIGALLCPEEA
ncbi:MAG TPA: phosphoribosylglycinamide formyltransferase [Burkholderiales bacterium]|nr:phosphoribosylglycinamide formyltransferase [Burkholderiales bacterium]